jgi:hypothetical protein
MNNISSIINLTEKLIALAVLLQSFELLQIRHSFSDKGVWRWVDLKEEFKIFSLFHQKIIEFFLKYENFLVLIVIRIFVSGILLFYSNTFLIFVLLISTILIALRWRGTFNGGSDYLTVLVLSALFFGSLFGYSEKASLVVVWYIAVQLLSSYFIAGVVKIRKKNWRTGLALKGFLKSTIYNENTITNWIVENSLILLISSWAIIIFEITFILTLCDFNLCLFYLIFALLFHCANFYFFGLNRFIYAWMACYPSLIYCSQFLNLAV